VSSLAILVATDQWSPDTIGGSARVAADSARALARRGHRLTVLAPVAAGRPPREEDGGVEVLRVLRRHGLPQTLADPPAARRAAARLGDRRFDVALAHQATNAAGLAGALDVPLALVFHASAVLESRFLRTRAPLPRRVVERLLDPSLVALERRAVSRARSVLVLSEYSRGLLVGRHPGAAGKTHLVAGGVEARFLEPPPHAAAEVRARYGVPDGATLLLTARRLEPRMGVEELVRALAALDDPRLALVVAGDGVERNGLTRLAESLGLAGRVRFAGRVPEDDLRSLYAAADLFVLPTVAYEGFGMSTVEALAAGTPVLGTAVGATPEILEPIDPALVVPRAEPDALADALRRVLPALGDGLRARCAAVARERYAWDAVVALWENALRETAN
jgi:glycosyltransferase involved in cell wall biosynthesis